MLLKAVDQATRPFKAIQTASKSLSGDIRTTQQSLSDLNGQASKIDGFRKTSSQLAVTGQSLKQAKQEAAALAIQFKNTESPTRAQARALELAKKNASDLQLKNNGLRLSVRHQRQELSHAGINPRKLSTDEPRLKTSISQTTAQLDRQRQALARVSMQQTKLSKIKSRYEAGQKLAACARNVGMAGTGIAMTGLYATSRFIAPGIGFDKQMSGTQAILSLDKGDAKLASIRQQARDNRGFEADQLGIELDDTDGLVALSIRSAVLSLYLGWKGFSLVSKGRFTVDEVEHRGAPDTVTIRARSADFRGTLNSRREESWHDSTLGAIVSAIAERNKLTASVTDSLAGIQIQHIDQSQESDAVFLSRLAERNGGAVSVKAGKLLMLRAGRGTTASGKAIPQITIQRSDGDRHQFAIVDRGAYTGVTAKWLHTKDPKPAKQKQTVKLKRKPKVQHLRALQHPKAKPMSATKAQAMRAAQAKWDKLQRGVAEFSIMLATGREDIYPEMPVRVSGFKSVIDDQSWIISKVTHNLGGNGFTTAVELEVMLSGVEYETDDDASEVIYN